MPFEVAHASIAHIGKYPRGRKEETNKQTNKQTGEGGKRHTVLSYMMLNNKSRQCGTNNS